MRGEANTRKSEPTKLPPALLFMQEHPRWTVWRLVQQNGRMTKPPFLVSNPQRHADPTNPDDWADHASAAAVVAAGEASGLQYILTPDGNVVAIDLDNCRDPSTGSIDAWAQQFIERAERAGAFIEISPSGCGIHIWGLTSAGTSKVYSNTKLVIDSKEVGVELFRRAAKALALTCNSLGKSPKTLGNIDELIDWAVVFVARHKAAAEKPTQKKKAGSGNGLARGGNGHATEEILRIVCEGAGDGGNRSNLFHTCVGHLHGIGWSEERICEYMLQHPDGIADKYINQGRLEARGDKEGEVGRCIRIFREQNAPQVAPQIKAMQALQEKRTKATRKAKEAPAEPAQEPEEAEDEATELPRLFRYNDPDLKREISWLIKERMPEQGIGLLVGQWGSFKSFISLDLALALGLAEKFLGRRIKRRSGTLLLAYEGAPSLPLRTHELVRDKYNSTTQVPFVWYDRTKLPYLLQSDALDRLIELARQAENDLQQKDGLPLGLIIIDTLAAAAGYSPGGGGENDAAAGIVLMDVQRRLAAELNCFVLGVGHFGKNPEAGTRGTIAKDDAIDVLWLSLGERSVSGGGVTNTRLKIQKCRDGPEGEVLPFTPRIVTAPEPDRDGDPVTTRVIDWQDKPNTTAVPTPPPVDRWKESFRQTEQQGRVLRLREALLVALKEHGSMQPIPDDGTEVKMIDLEEVRPEFYCRTPDADSDQRRKQFSRALEHAQRAKLIDVRDIEGAPHVWLTQEEEEEDIEPT